MVGRATEAKLENAEGGREIGGVSGGSSQQDRPGEKSTRQTEHGVGPRGAIERGVNQRTQLWLVPGFVRERRGRGSGAVDAAAAQVDDRYIRHGSLHLIALCQQQIAERFSGFLASRQRLFQNRRKLPLPIGVGPGQTIGDRRGGPVAKYRLQQVDARDGAPWPGFSSYSRLLGPGQQPVKPFGPLPLRWLDGNQYGQGQRRLWFGAPRGE